MFCSSFCRKPKDDIDEAETAPAGKMTAAIDADIANHNKLMPSRSDIEWTDKHKQTLTSPPTYPFFAPFSIFDSQHCQFYLFHAIEQCIVDTVVSSFIFIGPTSGSIFLRNVSDCTIVCCSAQLRLKNCHRLDMFIFSATSPAIESSTEIRISPFQYWYPELKG